MIRERDVEAYLVRRVKEAGGESRKVKWIGRKNAPDRRVMLKGGVWVEVKRPNAGPTSAQHREHERMRANGEMVTTVCSLEGVDKFIAHRFELRIWRYYP